MRLEGPLVGLPLLFSGSLSSSEFCLEAANEGLPQEIRDGGHGKPSIRCEFYESGVLIRLRYQTIPSDRQMISTEITRNVLKKFKENYDKVSFAYPHSVVRFRTDSVDDKNLPMGAEGKPN